MAEKEYIEREALPQKKELGFFLDNDFNAGWNACLNKIESIHAANVRPVVRGEWEEVEVIWLADIEDQPDAIASMFCPKCKRFANHVYHYGDPTYCMNYCPNCGADMREKI